MPGGTVGSIVLPDRPTQPVRLRKKVSGDPHPYGLSTVWLHPVTAQALRVDRWTGYSWIFTVHSGHLGGTVVGSIVTATCGLSLLGFGATGSWLWWARRSARLQRRTASA